MELADKTDESALDITAAEIAPNPIKETHVGVRYCNTMGRVRRVSTMVATPVWLFISIRPASMAPGTALQSSFFKKKEEKKEGIYLCLYYSLQ